MALLGGLVNSYCFYLTGDVGKGSCLDTGGMTKSGCPASCGLVLFTGFIDTACFYGFQMDLS